MPYPFSVFYTSARIPLPPAALRRAINPNFYVLVFVRLTFVFIFATILAQAHGNYGREGVTMKGFRRFKAKLYLFFKADLPMFFEGRSLFTKICLCLLAAGLAQLLLIAVGCGVMLGFYWVMSLIVQDKPHELMLPAEEIVSIQVIYVNKDVGQGDYPLDEIPSVLDSYTVVLHTLDPSEVTACLEDLSAMPASRLWHPARPHVWKGTLRITYASGSVEWICEHGAFSYDASKADGDLGPYYFDTEVFAPFLEKYGYQPPQ
jgi:hypothetical protein